MRPKLTIPQQIKDMKESGVLFNIKTEADASRFLEYNNYYFKLKAYEKNYDKYKSTERKNQYIGLEFAYLQDLSTIDSELRKLIFRLCIDLEHFLKVKMLADFNKVDEDGYEIIAELFKIHPEYKDAISAKVNTSTCNDLISKYSDEWAIWNIIEVLSFGQFSELFNLFYSRNSFKGIHTEWLTPVRMIRNAAAHNNCLVNRLRPPYSRTISPSYELKYIISKCTGINKDTVEKKLSLPAVHDFLALMFLFNEIVPNPTKTKAFDEVRELFFVRMIRNSEYYEKNQNVKSNYVFVTKVLKLGFENFSVDN